MRSAAWSGAAVFINLVRLSILHLPAGHEETVAGGGCEGGEPGEVVMETASHTNNNFHSPLR